MTRLGISGSEPPRHNCAKHGDQPGHQQQTPLIQRRHGYSRTHYLYIAVDYICQTAIGVAHPNRKGVASKGCRRARQQRAGRTSAGQHETGRQLTGAQAEDIGRAATTGRNALAVRHADRAYWQRQRIHRNHRASCGNHDCILPTTWAIIHVIGGNRESKATGRGWGAGNAACRWVKHQAVRERALAQCERIRCGSAGCRYRLVVRR